MHQSRFDWCISSLSFHLVFSCPRSRDYEIGSLITSDRGSLPYRAHRARTNSRFSIRHWRQRSSFHASRTQASLLTEAGLGVTGQRGNSTSRSFLHISLIYLFIYTSWNVPLQFPSRQRTRNKIEKSTYSTSKMYRCGMHCLELFRSNCAIAKINCYTFFRIVCSHCVTFKKVPLLKNNFNRFWSTFSVVILSQNGPISIAEIYMYD